MDGYAHTHVYKVETFSLITFRPGYKFAKIFGMMDYPRSPKLLDSHVNCSLIGRAFSSAYRVAPSEPVRLLSGPY